MTDALIAGLAFVGLVTALWAGFMLLLGLLEWAAKKLDERGAR